MDQAEGPRFDWVDSSVFQEIDVDFSGTFCRNVKDSHLQIRRLYEPVEDNKPLSSLHCQDVSSPDDISLYAEISDSCQVYCIGQKNSYSRLYITRDHFEQLLSSYSIFPRIWDFVLPFSFKTRESDIGHAPFRFRQSEPLALTGKELGAFECAYGFRYVERNHRENAMRDNPDYDPWSVRQSAIYQQYDSARDRVTFILISPSATMTRNLEEAVCRSRTRKKRLNAFDLHRIIISTLYENWRIYIRSLERTLTAQSDRVTLTQVVSETERLSPLKDFAVNFIDRQRLKMIEDKVLDLVIIFESLYHTLAKLKQQCQNHCLGEDCVDCTCSSTVDELEEQMHEAQVNLKKADILHKRAQGTAQLLSDLLDYENAQIAHSNEKSLNGLVKETKDENSKMRILTERSTQDAAAVKILTVITLIYLPLTVVANFFSTQLVHVDNNGQVSVVSGAWWLAVIAVPLTIATFSLWKLWLYYTIKEDERKRLAEINAEKASADHQSWSQDFGSKAAHSWPVKYVHALQNRRRGRLAEERPGA